MDALGVYEEIKRWKTEQLERHRFNLIGLNRIHDEVMIRVFQTVVSSLGLGNPPSSFCWLITGSGGRLEQGVISDQDHGMVFMDANGESEAYFLTLGKTLSDALNEVGYPYCKGKIMSSNPVWCMPLRKWKEQLHDWMEEGSWEGIRYLQIFLDSRCLLGEEKLCRELKDYLFQYSSRHPELLGRFAENVRHIKKAVSPLGQLLPSEAHGRTQSFDLKYSAFLPYVNAVRLASLKERIYETSTLGRMDRLLAINAYKGIVEDAKTDFQRLLEFRLTHAGDSDYMDSHYVKLSSLSPEEKKEIKRIVKGGYKLHDFVVRSIKKVDGYGI
ncbi:DUF294 nucleotidyltransferase-like domain-containing protein [Bacillus testis]|uniref:DUF294 nucleotidyltransferase-like domain-containing protein n=1 Tax=Bacillus testis TaxID=1622072 RepID=UPI00067F154C|nr:DUF294 nucleotidyltransferase-like domain-containing protein [Bacillus testis]